jgi:hypothetical protein
MLYAKRVLPKPFQQCAFSPLSVTITFFSFMQSLASLFLVTTRTAFGASATIMLPCFGATPYSFSSLWLCQNIVPSTRATAKMPSARVSYLKIKSLSSGLHLAIPKCNQMSVGFSSTHSTVFVRVLIIGMTI